MVGGFVGCGRCGRYAGRFTFEIKHFILVKPLADVPTCQP